MPKKKEWWQNFFGEFYVNGWRNRDLKKAPYEVAFIIKNIPLKRKDKILDLCCGYGRHALLLAQKGYDVVGLGYSAYELKIAEKEARKKQLKVKFIQGDARKMNFREEFDVILNMFTSFGYGSDKDNEQIIQNVRMALKKKGKFLIDTINAAYILNNFRNKDWEELGPQKFLLEKASYEIQKGRINNSWILIDRGKVYQKVDCHLRLYTYPEMERMIKKAGMRIKKVWGSFKGDKFDLEHKRMIILAQK